MGNDMFLKGVAAFLFSVPPGEPAGGFAFSFLFSNELVFRRSVSLLCYNPGESPNVFWPWLNAFYFFLDCFEKTARNDGIEAFLLTVLMYATTLFKKRSDFFMQIPFTKMQSLGNDFVVLDGVRQSIQLTAERVRQMGDRHLGIGFDQLLLIEPPLGTAVDFVYRIFNADGSEVGQCGNGARCVGRFLLETGLIPLTQERILLSTCERTLELDLGPAEERGDFIAVNMGIPIVDAPAIPFRPPSGSVRESSVDYTVTLAHQKLKIGVVSMGNPHVVLEVIDVVRAPVSSLGEKMAKRAWFPEGVNVGFVQYVTRDKILLRVYERGAGETLACGSGACAAVVVGQLRGVLDTEVSVVLPGGMLQVRCVGQGEPVWMIGPARIVFTGEWIVP
jgi:diaminopimelate epimerase